MSLSTLCFKRAATGLLLLHCLAGSEAFAQAVWPAAPLAQEQVFLVPVDADHGLCYVGSAADPVRVRVSMDDSRIVVVAPEPNAPDLFSGGCQEDVPLIALGRFPVGHYEVEVYWIAEAEERLVKVIPFEVQRNEEAGIGFPAHDYSGLYWSALLPGSALQVSQDSKGRLVASLITYDNDGNPTWLLIALGEWEETPLLPQVYRAPLLRTRNGSPPTLAPNTPASQVEMEVVGEAELRFSASTSRRLELWYRQDGVEVRRSLWRFRFE